MAERKAPTKRQQVGSKGKEQGSGTQSARGAAPRPTPSDVAATKQAESTDPKTYITASGTSEFQLQSAKQNGDGSHTPERTLRFDAFGLAEANDEDLDAVKQILAGEWSDGRVSAKTFQDNARMVGLGIHTYGMEQAPIPTWESLEPEQKVPVAMAAGMLSTVDATKRAIKYEKQSSKREPSRKADDKVVAQLEGHLAVLEAQADMGGPTSMPVVNHAGGGTIVGAAGVGDMLLGGPSELG